MVLCNPGQVDWSVINGRVVIEEGRLTTLDVQPHLRRHNEISYAMIRDEAY
jgi:hypothetical protein